MGLAQNLKNFLETEEGKKEFAKYAEKIVRKQNIRLTQIERLNKSGKFKILVEKAIKKYNSEEYRDRWYNRGIEPQESLYWFFYEYAMIYGRECNERELKRYGNMFTSALYYCDGYYFSRIDGQGSFILINRKPKR